MKITLDPTVDYDRILYSTDDPDEYELYVRNINPEENPFFVGMPLHDDANNLFIVTDLEYGYIGNDYISNVKSAKLIIRYADTTKK